MATLELHSLTCQQMQQLSSDTDSQLPDAPDNYVLDSDNGMESHVQGIPLLPLKSKTYDDTKHHHRYHIKDQHLCSTTSLYNKNIKIASAPSRSSAELINSTVVSKKQIPLQQQQVKPSALDEQNCAAFSIRSHKMNHKTTGSNNFSCVSDDYLIPTTAEPGFTVANTRKPTNLVHSESGQNLTMDPSVSQMSDNASYNFTDEHTMWTLFDTYHGVNYSKDVPSAILLTKGEATHASTEDMYNTMTSSLSEREFQHNRDFTMTMTSSTSSGGFQDNCCTRNDQLFPQATSTAMNRDQLQCDSCQFQTMLQHHTFSPGWKLSYQDFCPDIQMSNSGEVICTQSFSDLLKEANSWLRQNPQLEFKSCETITWSTSNNLHLGDTETVIIDRKLNHTLQNNAKDTFYINGLRIWVTPERCGKSKQADHQYQMTKCSKKNCEFKRIRFKDFKSSTEESLKEFISTVNNQLQNDCFKGDIVSMHSIYMPNFSKWNSQRLFWRENQIRPGKSTLLLRVFYREGQSTNKHMIGIKDICPEASQGIWDSFSILMKKATSWIRKETLVYVTNLQSVYVDRKCSEDSAKISSERSCRSNRNFQAQENFQILRLYYLKTATAKNVTCNTTNSDDQQQQLPLLPPGVKCSCCHSNHDRQNSMVHPLEKSTHYQSTDMVDGENCCQEQLSHTSGKIGGHVINCMTFTPVQTTLGPNIEAEFERMKQTMNRISAWLELAGATIRSAETFITPIITSSANHILPEMTNWMPLSCDENSSRRDVQKYLMHIRVFLEGDFHDPDPHLLPPLPYSLTVALQSSIQEREYKQYYKQKKSQRKRRKVTVLVFLAILLIAVGIILLDQLFDIFQRF